MNTLRCPKCDGAMREREGKRGRFLSCLRYPDCKGTREMQVTPVAEEGLAPQAIRMSPRTLSAILLNAVYSMHSTADDAREDAIAATDKLMARLADDMRRVQAARE